MKKRITALWAMVVSALVNALTVPFSLRRFRTGPKTVPSENRWLDALTAALESLRSLFLKLLLASAFAAVAFSAWKIHHNQAGARHLYLMLGSFALLAVALTVYLMHQKLMRRASISLGCMLVAGGVFLLVSNSHQRVAYNQGVANLDAGDVKVAAQSFDESIAAAKSAETRSGLLKLILPASDRYLQARTHFHKASALIKMSKGKEALAELQASLRLNPGNCFTGMSAEESAALYYDALCAQSNLEKLYKSGQGNGGRAKGKGQPGNRPGDRMEDGNQPGNQPGRQSRDKI